METRVSDAREALLKQVENISLGDRRKIDDWLIKKYGIKLSPWMRLRRWLRRKAG